MTDYPSFAAELLAAAAHRMGAETADPADGDTEIWQVAKAATVAILKALRGKGDDETLEDTLAELEAGLEWHARRYIERVEVWDD